MVATCEICGIELVSGEAVFCVSCITFIEWKYGSLEAYAKIHSKNS